MLPSIPISDIVRINPGILNAAKGGVDLNALILTQSNYIPTNQVMSFSSASDVALYFGATSSEAALARIYFSGYSKGTKTPGAMLFSQFNTTAQSAWLMGSSLQSVSLTTLKTFSGSLTVIVDGVTKTAASLSLSAATSFTNAASLIQTALGTGLTVTYDATRYAFRVTSTTSGASSTITVATGTVADNLGLSATAGAMTSPGANIQSGATAAAYMTNIVSNLELNWATFTTTFEPDSAIEQALATWTSQQNFRFAYIGWDSDAQAKVLGSTTTFGAFLIGNSVDGVIPIFSQDASPAVFAASFLASIDFDRRNGRATMAFKYQGGLTPSVTNATDASNLQSNGYNFLARYSNAKEYFNFMYPGQISGQFDWVDTYANQIWLSSNLQSSLISLLMGVGSIPYNESGYALIEAAMLDPVNAAVNFGAIRPGVSLSESQIAQIKNALGYDASQAIYAKGFVIDIKTPSAAVRAVRGSPSITLYYADGGSIQKITIASIAIQ